MKKILFLTVIFCFSANLCFAKIYNPAVDAESTLIILKEYRDIFDEKYGIKFQNNEQIRHDSSGRTVKGKVFGLAIEESGFSVEKTINSLIDAKKTRLAYTLPNRMPNRNVIQDLFENLEIYILSLKPKDISEANISEETRRKMMFWYDHKNVLKQLDTYIVKNNSAKANTILADMEKYGDIKNAKLRKIFMKFGGLAGVVKNEKEALKEFKLFIKDLPSNDKNRSIYEVMKWKHSCPEFGPTAFSIPKGYFRSNNYFHVALSHVLTHYPHPKFFAVLDDLARSGKFDPFSYYTHLNIFTDLDDKNDYKLKEKQKKLSIAKQALSKDWAEKYVIGKITKSEQYNYSIEWLAFYVLAPKKEEIQAIIAGKTPQQQQYLAMVERLLAILKNSKVNYYGKATHMHRSDNDRYIRIVLSASETNNTQLQATLYYDANVSSRGVVGQVEVAKAMINVKPFSLATLKIQPQKTRYNFLYGKDLNFSILPNGHILGTTSNLDHSIYLTSSVSLDSQAVQSKENSIVPEQKNHTPTDIKTDATKVDDKKTHPTHTEAKPEQKEDISVSTLSALSPTAPALKKPGKAIIIPTTTDIMSLVAFAPDKKPDSCVQVVALNPSPLTAVRLETMGGASTSWKTKDVKIKAQGVLAVMQDGKVINTADTSFAIDVTKETLLNLCVQDNGAIADVKTRLRVIFFHQDGSRNYAIVER